MGRVDEDKERGSGARWWVRRDGGRQAASSSATTHGGGERWEGRDLIVGPTIFFSGLSEGVVFVRFQ